MTFWKQKKLDNKQLKRWFFIQTSYNEYKKRNRKRTEWVSSPFCCDDANKTKLQRYKNATSEHFH